MASELFVYYLLRKASFRKLRNGQRKAYCGGLHLRTILTFAQREPPQRINPALANAELQQRPQLRGKTARIGTPTPKERQRRLPLKLEVSRRFEI